MAPREYPSCVSPSINSPPECYIPRWRNLRILERRFINIYICAVGHCKVQRSMKHSERYPGWGTVVTGFP